MLIFKRVKTLITARSKRLKKSTYNSVHFIKRIHEHHSLDQLDRFLIGDSQWKNIHPTEHNRILTQITIVIKVFIVKPFNLRWWNRELTPLLCRLRYEVGQRKSSYLSRQSNGRSNPEVVGSFPPRSKDVFFTSGGSLIPRFTRANAQWVIHGFN